MSVTIKLDEELHEAIVILLERLTKKLDDENDRTLCQGALIVLTAPSTLRTGSLDRNESRIIAALAAVGAVNGQFATLGALRQTTDMNSFEIEDALYRLNLSGRVHRYEREADAIYSLAEGAES